MAGWLHVITGPMYSGKTEALIREVRLYDIRGFNPILFRPAMDIRTGAVTSRAGNSWAGIPLSLEDLYRFPDLTDNRLVAFDEAQFFNEELPYVVDLLLSVGKRVVVSGLDRDFMWRPFGPMENLLTQADQVDKLTAICFVCKGPASLTQRLIDGKPAKSTDPTILLGGMGDDTYEARCRDHYE